MGLAESRQGAPMVNALRAAAPSSGTEVAVGKHTFEYGEDVGAVVHVSDLCTLLEQPAKLDGWPHDNRHPVIGDPGARGVPLGMPKRWFRREMWHLEMASEEADCMLACSHGVLMALTSEQSCQLGPRPDQDCVTRSLVRTSAGHARPLGAVALAL